MTRAGVAHACVVVWAMRLWVCVTVTPATPAVMRGVRNQEGTPVPLADLLPVL